MTRVRCDMDLGGKGLARDLQLPVEEQCPEGTWICLTTSTKPRHAESEPLRIRSVIPIAGNIHLTDEETSSTSKLTSVKPTAAYPLRKLADGERKVLEVTLNGGLRNNHPNSALLRVFCDPGASEPSEPVYVDSMTLENEGQQYIFDWYTRHGCPSTKSSGTKSEPNYSTVTASPTGVPPETTSPTLIDTESAHHQHRIIWIAGASVILLGAIYGIFTLYQQRTGSGMFGAVADQKLPQLGAPPYPKFSWAVVIKYLKKPFGRRSTKFGSQYHPLFAEEYEIPDLEDGANAGPSEDDIVVDFQNQSIKISGKTKNSRGYAGYGTVQ